MKRLVCMDMKICFYFWNIFLILHTKHQDENIVLTTINEDFSLSVVLSWVAFQHKFDVKGRFPFFYFYTGHVLYIYKDLRRRAFMEAKSQNSTVKTNCVH